MGSVTFGRGFWKVCCWLVWFRLDPVSVPFFGAVCTGYRTMSCGWCVVGFYAMIYCIILDSVGWSTLPMSTDSRTSKEAWDCEIQHADII